MPSNKKDSIENRFERHLKQNSDEHQALDNKIDTLVSDVQFMKGQLSELLKRRGLKMLLEWMTQNKLIVAMILGFIGVSVGSFTVGDLETLVALILNRDLPLEQAVEGVTAPTP